MDTRALGIRLQCLAHFCPGVTGMHPGADPVGHLPTLGRGRTRRQAGHRGRLAACWVGTNVMRENKTHLNW